MIYSTNTMVKTKFIRCDEEVHHELKMYSVRQKNKSLSDSIKKLLEGTTND